MKSGLLPIKESVLDGWRNSKFYYAIKVVLTPSCWQRLNKCDPEWDAELWNLLQNPNNIHRSNGYEALIGEHYVWIANAPYANGEHMATGFRAYRDNVDDISCSRKTALYLNDKLKEAKILMMLKS